MAKQMKRHTNVLDENTECLAHGWRQELDIASKYASYQAQFFDMLLKFQNM